MSFGVIYKPGYGRNQMVKCIYWRSCLGRKS